MGIFSAKACSLPPDALLVQFDPDNYTDCFALNVPGSHDLASFVAAFYTTRLFKAERFVLAHLAKAPATDTEALALGLGENDRFSVWRTEGRTPTQLLMCPRGDATRSWFMIRPKDETSTTLYFGSALILRGGPQDARNPMLRLTIAFHRLYSRALLSCAAAKLKKTLSP